MRVIKKFGKSERYTVVIAFAEQYLIVINGKVGVGRYK
jgi:hypothetical protein